MAEDKGTSPATSPPQIGGSMLDYVRASVFKYIIVAVLPSLAFIIMILYVSPCFSLLALPLIAVVLLWLFKINNLWHQIALGAVSLAVAGLLMAAVYMTAYTEIPGGLYSDDGVISNGFVTPFSGPHGTNYTFTVTVEYNATDIDPRVVIFDLYGSNVLNITMDLVSHSADNFTRNYSANRALESSVNGFIFDVKINGKWHESIWSNGPISSDSATVYGTLAWAWLLQIFGFCFMQFVVMLLFLRMSAKSKQAREKMMTDYRKKKDQALGQDNKEKSMSVKVEGTGDKEDTFVCSECGAEVKATAKYCPNCGEPFDEDEEEQGGSETEKK